MVELESFFDEHTMSVHLREGTYPYAKKGKPGEWQLVKLEEEHLTTERVQAIAHEIIEAAEEDPKSFVEISRTSSKIVQYKEYRVVIVMPPVADGWEITAVKPLVKLNIDDYNIPDEVRKRLEERSSGIIISGQVGSGKSTFAAALAEDYAKIGRITKTVESPRDLVLSDDITQYSKNLGTGEEIHDILFLTRPDNVIFDEMRDNPDFTLYIDIRLGGSSVIGVLHAATPIDTIQRFISRMEVGMIPSVLDTIIFIDKGTIGQVMTLKMTVKVPSGMTESDLARPIIEVRDFDTSKLMFEIYSYGEETVVIPIEANTAKAPAMAFAEKQIKRELSRYSDDIQDVEMIGTHKVRIYVPKGAKAKIIGAKGANIIALEKKLGIGIDVVTSGETTRKELKRLGYHVSERGKNIIFSIKQSGKMVDIFIEEDFLFTSTSSKKGEIRVNRKSDIGQKLMHAFETGKKVYIKG
jgi:ATPase